MKQPLKKVFVVFKTHFDIGFTHLAKDVVSWYGKEMIEDVLQVCRATKNEPEGHRYVWTVPSWPMKKTLETIENPEVLRETEEYLRSGQLVWHGLPFTTHTEVCGMEDFVRGMLTGMRLGETYGRRVRDAKMTDVPGHPWILPTLLHKAGIRFLHLGSNFCATPPNVPRLFWWEGPDGSRLLTYYSKGGYGSDLIPPEDWEYPYWLAMLQTLDNLGAQNTDYLQEMFERAQRELPGVEISIGTLEDFGEAMIQSGVEIPVIRGDLSDSWIRGVGSAPQGVAELRRLRSQAEGCQSALVLAQAMEQDKMEALCDEAYEKLLLFAEHTWSMDTKVTILPERYYGAPWIGFRFWETGTYDKNLFERLRTSDAGYLKLQESWKEQLDYLSDARNSLKKAEELLQKSHTADLTVLGTLGFEIRHTLDLDDWVKDYETPWGLEDNRGNVVPIYRNMQGRPVADIVLPALGAESYRIVATGNAEETIVEIARMEEGMAVLENQWIRAVIDPEHGVVVSLFYKPAQREWVNRDAAFGFGQYQYDIYSSQELDDYLKDYLYILRDWGVNDTGKAGYPKEQGHESFVPSSFNCQIKNGPGWGGVELTAEICGRSITNYGNARYLKTEIILREKGSCLDFTYHLLDKQPTPFIESGHFVFPLQTEKPQYLLNKLGCVLDPQKDVLDGCNMDLYCLEGWTAVEENGCGMAIAVKEAPLMSYENPGILRFDRKPEIQESTLLMLVFNNAWGTNFPQWTEGNMTFSYRLIPYTGSWRENHIWQKAEEFRYVPFITKGTVETKRNIVKGELEGLRIQTLKQSEDGKGYVLRVSDISGERQVKTIHFAVPVKNVALCTLMEEKKEVLKLSKENSIAFESEPYEIHTCYFEV